MTVSFSMRRSAFVICCVAVLIPVRVRASDAATSIECTRALNRSDYASAEQLATKYLRQFPKNVAVRVLLARAELAQGRLLLAFEDLRRALAINPQNIDGLYYLSLTARALSDQEYQRLFSMDPNSSRVHQLLAEAALEAQNPTVAEAEFQKALAANPRSPGAATELAELKRSQSKFDEAIVYYSQAAKVGALNYDIAYGLGACYTYQQNYASAAEWLRKAVSFAPESVAAHFALGNAFFQSGEMEAAIPELKVTLRLEPRMKQAYFLLGRAYTKLGRKDEAAAAFKKLDELSGSGVPDLSGAGPNATNKADERP